jgi:hypothetical protein
MFWQTRAATNGDTGGACINGPAEALAPEARVFRVTREGQAAPLTSCHSAKVKLPTESSSSTNSLNELTPDDRGQRGSLCRVTVECERLYRTMLTHPDKLSDGASSPNRQPEVWTRVPHGALLRIGGSR